MKEWIADSVCNGMRVDKYLQRMLPSAGAGFLQKMLRKKNITVNGKKALGADRLHEGDRISVYFSDETFAAFSAPKTDQKVPAAVNPAGIPVQVLYEDDDIIALNKPAGVLTQKASAEDVSLNEAYLSWLVQERGYTPEMLSFFTPAAANRLDRNTSGIVLAGKTLPGQQKLSAWLSGADPKAGISKTYRAIVSGNIQELLQRAQSRQAASSGLVLIQTKEDMEKLPESLLSTTQKQALQKAVDQTSPWVLASAWLLKDHGKNVSEISMRSAAGAQRILTAIHLRKVQGDASDVELLLLTGKSHQLRAHLAWLGYGIVNDPKYGKGASQPHRGRRRQLLHAWRADLPEIGVITAPLPEDFPAWAKDSEDNDKHL